MRSSVLLFALAFSTAAQAQSLQSEPATVQVGVLSLFHPRTLILSADHPVTLLLDGMPEILDAHQQATLSAAADGLRVTFPGSQGLAARRLTLPESSFTLAVPEKLTRNYRGSLSVTVRSGTLTPVIAMDTELAVASIVAAESPPHAPAEALKAQAIASRSFLLANRGAHQGFDACDTTHCQYLRSPPTASSPAAIATRSTRGMVLTWRASPEALPQIVRAMYSRSCGGQTRVPPASVTANSYPFYPVRCEYCRRHRPFRSRTASLTTGGMAGRRFLRTTQPNPVARWRVAEPATASGCVNSEPRI
jgi:hypothetical protein